MCSRPNPQSTRRSRQTRVTSQVQISNPHKFEIIFNGYSTQSCLPPPPPNNSPPLTPQLIPNASELNVPHLAQICHSKVPRDHQPWTPTSAAQTQLPTQLDHYHSLHYYHIHSTPEMQLHIWQQYGKLTLQYWNNRRFTYAHVYTQILNIYSSLIWKRPVQSSTKFEGETPHC